MNALILLSLVDPEILKDKFTPSEGLHRLARIAKAGEIAAIRRQVPFEADTFFESISGPLFPEDLREWEIKTADRIFYHLFRKRTRKEKFFTSKAFYRGFYEGMESSQIRLDKKLFRFLRDWLSSDLDSGEADSLSEHLGMLRTFGGQGFPLNADEEGKSAFAKGYLAGKELHFNEDGSFTGETVATRLYMVMLLFGPELSQCASVKEMHTFLKDLQSFDLPHELESFKQLCTRIGLRGRRYNAH